MLYCTKVTHIHIFVASCLRISKYTINTQLFLIWSYCRAAVWTCFSLRNCQRTTLNQLFIQLNAGCRVCMHAQVKIQIVQQVLQGHSFYTPQILTHKLSSVGPGCGNTNKNLIIIISSELWCYNIQFACINVYFMV